MKNKKWNDEALHRAGCPYRGIAVYANEQEMARYHSGYCPGCNIPVKWSLESAKENSENSASSI